MQIAARRARSPVPLISHSIRPAAIEGMAAQSRRPALRDVSRRDIFIWVVFILFFNQLFDVLRVLPSASVNQIITDLGAVGIFQYLAWYAIFSLMLSSDLSFRAKPIDLAIGLILSSFCFLPTNRAIWVAMTGSAIYLYFFATPDPKLRSAGIILAALAVQQLWGHVLFHVFAYPLLCAETAVVGSFLEVIRSGTVWQNNEITGPSGFGIIVYDGCSSFHNLSLAMLCWITINTLRNDTWRRRDFVAGSLIGIGMIIFNMLRLILMAWNIDLYAYWHHGLGSEIFAAGISLFVLLASLYGSRQVEELA